MSQQINLYNPIFLKQEKYFSSRAIAQALGLVIVGLAVLYVFALTQTRKAEALGAETRAQVAAQRDRLVKITPRFSPEARSKVLEAEAARLEAEVKTRRATLDALSTGELGNTSGFSEYMAALGRQAVEGVWITGVSIAESGGELHIQGRALRPELVPAYLQALNQEPMMRGRQVTEMKLAARQATPTEKPAPRPSQYVEFSLAAKISQAGEPK
ncbi:MAG TPA: PilN domain-containing protein [Burkholderiales bacterium]|nr:PilN domain-containing protein [Burkholderiales bacterium]